jgi:hypothetical protein
MIVLGADMHKSSHTIAALAATTGEMLANKTAAVGARGSDQVLQWARTLRATRRKRLCTRRRELDSNQRLTP